MDERNDQDALYCQEQERELTEAVLRLENGLGTVEDGKIVRGACGLPPRKDARHD